MGRIISLRTNDGRKPMAEVTVPVECQGERHEIKFFISLKRDRALEEQYRVIEAVRIPHDPEEELFHALGEHPLGCQRVRDSLLKYLRGGPGVPPIPLPEVLHHMASETCWRKLKRKISQQIDKREVITQTLLSICANSEKGKRILCKLYMKWHESQGEWSYRRTWHPDDSEKASCCLRIRPPSMARPLSFLQHVRSKKHRKTLFAENPKGACTELARYLLSKANGAK